MSQKLKVGIVGATGMVGQRFVILLANHPWFQVVSVAASERSAGRSYTGAAGDRWAMATPIPPAIGSLTVANAADVDAVSRQVDFIFCAVDMPKDQTRDLEDRYEKAETPVVSNNSAHRATPDVPMLLPEINADHLAVIASQRRRLGTRSGFIAVKPNCSIQSFVPALHPLREFASGHFGSRQDLQGLARDGGQCDPVHRRGRGEERKRAAEGLGRGEERTERSCRRPGNHEPVHPRPRHRRPSCGGLRVFPEEAGPGENL